MKTTIRFINVLFLYVFLLLITNQQTTIIHKIHAEYFTGDPASPAYSCSDVLNAMLKRGYAENLPDSVPNVYFKRRFIDKDTTYIGNCYFDKSVNPRVAWTEIYTFTNAKIDNNPSDTTVGSAHTMDGSHWKSVSFIRTPYMTKYESYVEVPFNRIKLKFGSNNERTFSLSGSAYSVDTNSDWKIPSLYHIYNKIDTGGNLLTNMKIVNDQTVGTWGSLGETNVVTECTSNIMAGFRLQTTLSVKRSSDIPSVLFGFYAPKRDSSSCTSGAFWLIGTGFGNSQTTYQQGNNKMFQGTVVAGATSASNIYQVNTAYPKTGGVMVSEGPLDCSAKGYCSLNGRCISSDSFGGSNGVCDCVRAYSGDKSCSLPIYSGQDMLVYLKAGNTFKSLTNTFHAMVEENAIYSDNGFLFSGSNSNKGISFPHLSFGTYSEPFSLPNDFTIAFRVKYTSDPGSDKRYAISFASVDNSGIPVTQFSIFLQKSVTDRYLCGLIIIIPIFCDIYSGFVGFNFADTTESKNFGDVDTIFGDDFKWIVLRRDTSVGVSVNVGKSKQISASAAALNYNINSPGILIVGATTKDSTYLYDNGLQNSLGATMSNLMVFNRALTDNEVNNIIDSKTFCFKIDSSSPEVCNGVNVCSDFNICDCPSPFQGQNCHLFKQGQISGNTINYGVTGTQYSLTLTYTYPLLNNGTSTDKLKGTFYCGFSDKRLFPISFTPGSTSFQCIINSQDIITDGLYVNLYYKSPIATAPVVQVSSGSSVQYFAITANNEISFNYRYWVPNTAISGLQAYFGHPVKVSTQIQIGGVSYNQISVTDNYKRFNYEDIVNPIMGTSQANSQTLNIAFIVQGNTYGTGQVFVFGQGNTNYAQPNFNALRVNSNGAIVINDFGFSIYNPMKNMMYCSFGSNIYNLITFDSTSNLYTCTIQSSNIGVNTLQIYAKGSNNAYGVVSLNPKKFNIYKNDIISYTGRLIFLTTESTPSFTIGLSQYSITTPPDFDFRSQIKCLVSGSTIPSTPIVSDSNSVTAVTCQPSISQEGSFNLNVVHDYNPGYLSLSDLNIKFYTFSPRNLSPSKFAKLVHTPGDVIVNVVGNELPYNTDTTAFNYRIVMNSNIIIPSTPQVNGGLVTQFTITFPSYNTEFYNTDVKLQVVKGTDVIDLSTMQLSIISPKTISLIGNNYVIIGSNSTLQFALNDTIIPQSVIEGFLCEFNSTYHFPIKFANNILSCDVSNTGTLPGIYTLRLVSGDLTSRISENDLNIYALGGLYNINYYTPSVFPQSQSYFVKVATNDQSNSFFNLNTTFKYYFQTSISKETFPVDFTKLSDGTITLSSSFKLPGSQTFSLLLSYQGMNFTLNTFDIYFLNTLPLRLHSSSDIVELINNNANIKLETTSYTLQGMTSRFVKCKNEGNYVNVLSNTDYPTIITCSFTFNSFGFKTISLVYDDSLNAMFDISTSIDFPIIDPKPGDYKVGTRNMEVTGNLLTTVLVSNTWLPNYLQNDVKCIGLPSPIVIQSTTLSTETSTIARQEYSCVSTASSIGDYYLSLQLIINGVTRRQINLLTSPLPVQFITLPLASSVLSKVEPVMALFNRNIQPIIYVTQDIPMNTTVLDYKCVFLNNEKAILAQSTATKKPDKTFICDLITLNSGTNGNYKLSLNVVSRMNPNNYAEIFFDTHKNIYFVKQAGLELTSTSVVALQVNSPLNAAFVDYWSYPVATVYPQVKFIIGSNNYNPTINTGSLSLVNGPSLSVSGYMPIELWFKSSVSSSFDFALSTNAFQYPFVEQQTVSFNTSFVNGAYVNQPFTSKLRYNGFLGLNSPLSSVAPSLHNRVYCSIGATFVKASRYDYISENISEFECPLQYSTKGVISGGLYLLTSPGNNEYFKLQNIDLTYVIVEKITITKVAPFTALTSKIPFDITFNSISMDYPSTRLYCAYNSSNGIISERFQLTRNDGNSFTCRITSAPPTRDIVQLFFIIETIATSTSLIYSNNIDFYFQEVIPLNYLDPFVYFSDFTTVISPSSVRIGSNSVILTDKKLYCQYDSNNDILRISEATLTEDKRQITCSIQKTNFKTGTTIDYINISLLQFDDAGNNFTLSQIPVNYAIIKTPILLNENPNYFQTSDIENTKFKLNFNSLTGSSNLYLNLLMDYYLVGNVQTRLNIPCDSTGITPLCTFNITGKVYQMPQPLAFTVSIGRLGQTQIYSSPITKAYYYLSNSVTIKGAMPFILDYNTNRYQSNIVYTLDTSTSTLLNTQNFANKFNCVFLGNNQSPTRAIIKQDNFNCNVNGPTNDGEHVTTYLQFQDDTTQLIVSNSEDAEFSSLGFVSEFARKDDFDSHLLYYSNTSTLNYIIPQKYRQNSILQLKLNDTITDIGFNTYPCTIDQTMGIVNCTKGIVYPDIGYTTKLKRGIQFAYPYLLFNGSFLTSIDKPFVLYTPSFITVFPTAVYRQHQVLLEYRFSNKTLDIALDSTPFSVNCLIADKHYIGTITGTNTMLCNIPFTDFSIDSSIVSSYLSLPSFTSTNVTISTNNPTIYILDKYSISYAFGGNGEESIMTNSIAKVISIKIDSTIPNAIKSSQFINCKVSNYNSFLGKVDTMETTTQFWKYESGSTFYNCTINSNTNFIGTGNVSLLYTESNVDGAVYSFELSNNKLPLYVTGFYSLQTAPMVTTINRTMTITLSSDLRAKQSKIDYSIPSNYYIRSNNSATGELDYSLITSFPPTLDVFSAIPSALTFVIVMGINGVNITITQPATFTFLDGFYHEPNYGIKTGGEYILLLGHTYNPVEDVGKKMVFKDYPAISFNWSVSSGNTLNCSTPDISKTNLQIFSPYIVQFGGKELATQYVVYDNIPSYVFEKIFPTFDRTANLLLVTSSNITLQGNSYFSFVVRTDENDPYPTILSFTSIVNNLTLSIPSNVQESYYETQLYFSNPFLFTPNNWIGVNEKENVYFIDRRNANFLNSKTIFYIEKDKIEQQSISFSFDKSLLEEHRSYVYCKTSDNILFASNYNLNTNTFTCNISSNTATSKSITIWLINKNVYNGGIQLSNNGLEVMFIEKISLNEIKPYALVGITSSNVKLLLSPMTTSSLVSQFNKTKVAIMCNVASGLEGSNYFPYYTPIEITNEYVICSISKTTTVVNYVNVKLVAYNSTSTVLSNVLDVTSNSIQVPFYEKNNLIRSYPFIQDIDIHYFDTNTNYYSNQTIYFTTNSLMLMKDLYCSYSIEGSSQVIVTAYEFTSNSIKCDIGLNKINILNDKATLVDITLQYILTNDKDVVGTFSGSSNFISFQVIYTPIQFNINATDNNLLKVSNLNSDIDTNFFIPPQQRVYYSLSIQNNENNFITITCKYDNYGNPLTCQFSQPKFNEIPSYIHTKLIVTDTRSGDVLSYSLVPVLYYEKIDFTTLYPFILSFREQDSKKIYYQLTRALNQTIVYYIDITSSSGSNTYSVNNEYGSTYSSSIYTYSNKEELIRADFGFYIPQTGIKVLLSNSPAQISIIDKVILKDNTLNSFYSLPINSGGLIQSKIPNNNPTVKSTISDYSYDFKMNNRGKFVSLLLNNAYDINSIGNVQFTLNRFNDTSSLTLPNDYNVDLFINNQRAFTFFGKLTLFDIPIITKILPSDNVLVERSNVLNIQQQFIYLISNQFTFTTVKNATIYYSCPTSLECISGLGGSNNVERQSCDLSELNSLRCQVPTFTWNYTLSNYLPISMSLTLNGKDIMPLAKQFSLYIKDNIVIERLSDYEFYKESNKDIYIYGSMFYPSSLPIQVMIYDSIITRTISATFINDKTIKFTTPLLFDINIQFPRLFKVALSFDGGKSYTTNQNIVLSARDLTTNQQVLIESPLYVPINTTITNLIIKYFPINSFSLQSGERIALELYTLDNSYSSEIVCGTIYSDNTLVCSASTPDYATTLYLRAFVVVGTERKSIYFNTVVGSKIEVYNKALVTSSVPKYILKSSTKSIYLYGSFPSAPISNVRFLVSPLSNVVRSIKATKETIDITNTFKIISLTNNMIELSIIPQQQALLNNLPLTSSLQISFDNGTNYDLVTNEFYLMNDYRIIYLRNDLTEDSRGIYTFLETPITLGGLSLPFTLPQTSWKFKLQTKFYEKIYSPNDFNNKNGGTGVIVDNAGLAAQNIKFNMPSLEQFLNGSSIGQSLLDFPMDITVSVTFNDYDYRDITTKYLDRYQEVIVTSVFPNIIPRMDYLLRIEGSNLGEAISCLFTSAEFLDNQHPITVPIAINGTSIIYCLMPAMPKNVNNVYLTLINNRNETSKNPTKIIYYENPRMKTDISPTIVPTHALINPQEKMTMTVMVENYRSDLTLYAKFGTIFSSQDKCKLIEFNANGAYLSCPILAHEAGTVPVCIGYNRNDWYTAYGLQCDSIEANNLNVTMSFFACDKGYSAHTYKEICYKCPAGTYKPTSGIYSCVDCELNLYNEMQGSTSCSSCPRFSVTLNKGSANLTQCLCLPEYYHNPNLDNSIMYLDPLDYYCLPCPPGASCNSTGTYKPIANYGFWYSNESVYTEYQFYECFPHASCGGMGLNNCSNGYTGINCGVCARGYYRWRNGCQECESYAWLKILLLLVAIGIVSIGLLAFSSIKISHLASISIAFSYTQVISMFSSFDIQWPWAMGDVFVASSITNFNISFVSPECWIPDISYFTRWLITSLLPFYFAIAFTLLYIIGITRSFIASKIGHKIKWKYMGPYEDESERPDYDEHYEQSRFEYMTLKQKLKYTSKMYLKKFGRIILNFLIWLRNFGVWSLKQKQTKDELRVFLNMIMNSYTAFLSFCFVFIMTNASQTFVCNKQSTGDYTLQASPDILCFGNDERWLTMLPISIIFYVIFGLGGALFFVAIYIMKQVFAFKINKLNRDEDGNELIDLKNCKSMKEKILKENELLERDPKLKIQYKNFYQRLKFILKRFRRKYFYWEAVITLRKLIISILHIFLKPLVVIVMAIAVIFIAMILHMWVVPFKHKFHNVMEYFVLMATLVVLFFGLLFFVQSFPAAWLETAAVWVAIIVIVLSVVFVCLMALQDVITRIRSERAKKRKRRQELISQFGEEQAKKQLKEYESNLFSKSTKTIIEDLDEGNEDDPWIIIENEYCRIVQEEMMQFKEEDFYYDGKVIDINLIEEEERWNITENTLRKAIVKFEEKDDWVVVQNPLNEQYQFDYQQLEMKIYHIEFNLPFFEDEQEVDTSDEEAADSINDLLDNLFSKERMDKKKKALKKKLSAFKRNYLTKRKAVTQENEEEGDTIKLKENVEIEELEDENNNDTQVETNEN